LQLASGFFFALQNDFLVTVIYMRICCDYIYKMLSNALA